jgi:PIN domain nuclease of toxin-antitoxin system
VKVFDASAVLAILYNEPGADRAAAFLPVGHIAMANVTEAVGDLLVGGGGSIETCEAVVRSLGLVWVPTHDAHAVKAAELKPLTGLSLGDRCCLALAIYLNAPVLTSDQIWAQKALPIPVELIR